MLQRTATAIFSMIGITNATISMDHATQEPMKNKLSCSSDDAPMTVHMVHHTHDDVGWLKTPDEYFSGINDNI